MATNAYVPLLVAKGAQTNKLGPVEKRRTTVRPRSSCDRSVHKGGGETEVFHLEKLEYLLRTGGDGGEKNTSYKKERERRNVQKRRFRRLRNQPKLKRRAGGA